MHVGIVGHEAAKFTPATEAKARELIRGILAPEDTVLVSGGCHLGGIDIWAEEEADALGREKVIHLPHVRNWSGYKRRNVKIARDSEVVYSIVVETLPASYRGMRFTSCYHCGTDDHVKSGGCWTARHARQLGKEGVVLVVRG